MSSSETPSSRLSASPLFRTSEEETYSQERKVQLKDYEEKWGSAYPHKFQVSCTLQEYRQKYETTLEAGEITGEEPSTQSEKLESLTGRIKTKRGASKKLFFYTVSQEGHEVQFLLNFKYYENPDQFKALNKILHMGDLIGATGVVAKSKKGELSLIPRQMHLLAPCFYSIPREQFGLKDVEKRVRDRHLDLLVNPKSRRTFMIADQVINLLRDYLRANRFVEVRTPILASQAGGASARPFQTHHHELDQSMFMRVAPELYLKSLVVGGLDRVFEIGPQFRNEGIDPTHNPEFYTLEFYEAYADFNDLMVRCEELFPKMAQEITGSLKVKYHPLHPRKGQEELEIDFTPPFRRLPIVKTLEEKTGYVFPPLYDNEETVEFLKGVCEDCAIVCPLPHTPARLIDRLVGELIEPECQNPTFLCDHPLVMSPLAKWHREDPTLSERFELFIAGMEVVNAYTELNDPKVQEEMFQRQMAQRAQGDVEAQEIDYNYIRTLGYGLPPTAGFGAGIERLTMIFSDNSSIRDVILYPARHEPKEKKEKKDTKLAEKMTPPELVDAESESASSSEINSSPKMVNQIMEHLSNAEKHPEIRQLVSEMIQQATQPAPSVSLPDYISGPGEEPASLVEEPEGPPSAEGLDLLMP